MLPDKSKSSQGKKYQPKEKPAAKTTNRIYQCLDVRKTKQTQQDKTQSLPMKFLLAKF